MLFNHSVDTVAPPVTVQIPTDKTKRKRLKVVSACGECRRKKTKCNGEKPCAGCIKTNIECTYANGKTKPTLQHGNHTRSITTTTTSSTATFPITSTCPESSTTTKTPQSPQSPVKENATIQAIESRLGVIEDILRILLLSTNNNNTEEMARNSAFHPQQRHASSGPYYGEMHSYPPYPQDVSYRPNKRKYQQDDQVHHLPPPINYQPTLSESSSTSTTSSVSSSTSSPKINTIQALLNNEKDDYKYYQSRPSAFSKPIATTARPY